VRGHLDRQGELLDSSTVLMNNSIEMIFNIQSQSNNLATITSPKTTIMRSEEINRQEKEISITLALPWKRNSCLSFVHQSQDFQISLFVRYYSST
jgi:hypothetical protein